MLRPWRQRSRRSRHREEAAPPAVLPRSARAAVRATALLPGDAVSAPAVDAGGAGPADVPSSGAPQHRLRQRYASRRRLSRVQEVVQARPGHSAAAAHGGRARAVHRLLLLTPPEQCSARGRRRMCRWRGVQILAPGKDEPFHARRVRRQRRRGRTGVGYVGGVPLCGDVGEQSGREEQRHDVVRRRGVPELRRIARAPPASAADAAMRAGAVQEPRRGLPVVRRRRILLAARLVDEDLELAQNSGNCSPGRS